ncbi:helix-turn-helix domain-containing protein [Lapillicoccus jejuensis]|uniref:Uncharacterized protein DUF86 n=1 Tax=Lapillicoccus jejuensis TaxID=402171 RepID=A0A542E2E6_9MICO|nr:helix-turn-helix domain-containing protein [Lapillicoccus jejuensis]TQJ09510.1 uncharacterized protein DUF86 [Lapillicoccus jejuensis]
MGGDGRPTRPSHRHQRKAGTSTIAQLRTAAGLTQQELGDLSGVARSTIAAYESGRRHPSPPMVARLAAAARIQRDDRDVVEEHPEISWRAMKGMRDVVAHEHGAIDHELLWRTLSADVSREAELLRLLAG